ncbi:MAG: P22 phage major capsid protein family protein [Clostridia bacterium]
MPSSNTLLTPTIIAKEALMQLTNSMAMSRHVHTAYKNEFVKVGQTVTIRKPNKFRATDSSTLSYSDIKEPSTSITMSTQSHVGWSFSSVELTTTIEDYSKRYITPAAAALANKVDTALCGLYVDVWNYAGTPGTTPATFKVLGDCQTILDDEAAPAEGRVAILNPAAHWSLADGLKGTFAPSVAKDIITKGYLGTIGNLSLYMDQNVKRHTTGAFSTSATPLIAGNIVTAATTLNTDGWNASSSTVLKGDIFTVSSVYGVNPMSGESTGNLKRWVATTATTTSSGGVMATLAVSPTVTYAATDPYTNCFRTAGAMNIMVDNDVMTFVGSESTAYPQNLVFHPNAFALVTVPIEMPSNVWGARETDPEAGLSIRVVKQYSIGDDLEICRLDILYGVKTLYPELAVRLFG